MPPHDPTPQTPRETILTVLLASVGLAFFLGLLILISGGLFFWVLLFTAGIGAFAGLHYLLWGWLLPRPELPLPVEEELQQRAEADAWPSGSDQRIRRRDRP
jgi:hypothetical protein